MKPKTQGEGSVKAEDWGEDWGDKHTSQGTSKIASKPPKAKKDFPTGFREHGPADILTSACRTVRQ